MSTPRGHRPAHRTSVRRAPVIVVVVGALVVAGLVAGTRATPTPPNDLLGARAAPIGAESSSWYCAGGTGTPGGSASPTLYLVNRGPEAIEGTVSVVTDTGGAASAAVSVPARSQTTEVPTGLEQGTWIAARVDLDGGGVTVSQLVEGPYGWAQSPCASTTATSWYLAAGATTNGSTMFVALYNPSATAAVVDLAFATPQGLAQPMPFQGLVIGPGQLVVAGVAAYVQNQSSVSTVVRARSGRIVAQELQEYSTNSVTGLSLRLGTPEPQLTWSLPRSVDVTGGTTALSIFNPGQVSESVTVSIRLPSGPVSPFVGQVAADSTWVLDTSASGAAADRVPANQDFATTVRSSGGVGVVVDRTVTSSSAGAAPQWGTVSAIPGAVIDAPSRQWVLPNPTEPAQPPEPGATPFALAIANPTGNPVTVSVSMLTPSGLRRLGPPASVLAAGAFSVIEQPALSTAVDDPVVVDATGPVAVMEDGVPAGQPGVVSMPGIPQG